MALTDTHRATHSGIAGWAGEQFPKFAARLTAWRTYRRTLAELRALTDRELRDLGINQSMIQQIAWDAAYVTR